MKLDFDPRKRAETLAGRALDFGDAGRVFAGPKFTIEDRRRDYGEPRFLTFGMLGPLVVVVGWTPREVHGSQVRRIFSMRRANEKEVARYQERFG